MPRRDIARRLYFVLKRFQSSTITEGSKTSEANEPVPNVLQQEDALIIKSGFDQSGGREPQKQKPTTPARSETCEINPIVVRGSDVTTAHCIPTESTSSIQQWSITNKINISCCLCMADLRIGLPNRAVGPSARERFTRFVFEMGLLYFGSLNISINDSLTRVLLYVVIDYSCYRHLRFLSFVHVQPIIGSKPFRLLRLLCPLQV